MHDRSLKFIDLYMLYPDLNEIPDYPLPPGYSFRLYSDGDEQTWIDIEVDAGEIPNVEEGHKTFMQFYGEDIEKLKTRCLFLLDPAGYEIGTATGFYMKDPIDDPEITGHLHWVAIRQAHRGRGLAKPLIAEAMKVMQRHGHQKAFLHSQTHTWLACTIYQSLGWQPYQYTQTAEEYNEGWEIVAKAKSTAAVSG